jgi:acetyl esterase
VRTAALAFASTLALVAETSALAGTCVEVPDTPARLDYRVVEGRSLAAHLFMPHCAGERSTAAAIVLVHGGGWTQGRVESTFAAARSFAEQGFVAVPIEYRLSFPGGTTPLDALSDVCTALGWVRGRAGELGIDPARVAAYGVSAGGHLAAAAATVGCGHGIDGPDALLLLTPVLDTEIHDGFEALLPAGVQPEALSPAAHLAATVAPTHIVQGAEDTVTPTATAEGFCLRLQAQGTRCVIDVYPRLGHVLARPTDDLTAGFDPDPVSRADALERHVAFLHRLWRRAPDDRSSGDDRPR